MGKDNSQKGESVARSASILVITTLISSVLGYVRNIVITSKFGAGVESDAYYAAFTIPDLIYTTLVGGGLSSAFIPVFSGYLAKKE
jgi:putative peptidoglycan lipid II flippase